jgi:hypothetical protein
MVMNVPISPTDKEGGSIDVTGLTYQQILGLLRRNGGGIHGRLSDSGSNKHVSHSIESKTLSRISPSKGTAVRSLLPVSCKTNLSDERLTDWVASGVVASTAIRVAYNDDLTNDAAVINLREVSQCNHFPFMLGNI